MIATGVLIFVFTWVLTMILLVAVHFAGFATGVKCIQREAVKKGFAEWMPDEFGNNDFQWIKGSEDTE